MSKSIRPVGGVIRYRLRFSAPGGCPMSVLTDMARFDAAEIIETKSDDDCYIYLDEREPNVREATLRGAFWPTMERWRSFWVGTTLEETVEGPDATS